MDWLTKHGGMAGTTIRKIGGPFTDLDFVNDVVLLTEMLSVMGTNFLFLVSR